MKTICSAVFCALGLLATSCSTTTQKMESPELEARTARIKLHQVAWLTGTWNMPRKDGFTKETWLPPQGGMMLGLSYTVRGEHMRAFEYLRIETRGDTLVYIAQPHGDSPGIEFFLTQMTSDSALFENPEHEFPKWIRYERRGDQACVATIGGKSGTIEFSYEQEVAAVDSAEID